MKQCPHLACFLHVSTAFVASSRGAHEIPPAPVEELSPADVALLVPHIHPLGASAGAGLSSFLHGGGHHASSSATATSADTWPTSDDVAEALLVEASDGSTAGAGAGADLEWDYASCGSITCFRRLMHAKRNSHLCCKCRFQ